MLCYNLHCVAELQVYHAIVSLQCLKTIIVAIVKVGTANHQNMIHSFHLNWPGPRYHTVHWQAVEICAVL